MSDTYSVDEATTQLTAIIARVREGETIAISDHGVPIAEIRPLPPHHATIEERFAWLEARGELVRPPAGAKFDFTPGPPRPGALAQFLAERD